MFWSWGLSDEHDTSPYGANIENAALQQFTVNLFADMGIQPGVADAILASQGLVRATASTDTVAATTTMKDLPGHVSALQPVTITGTATDDDGNPAHDDDGKVAVVEVSVDGGTTWKVAEAADDWATGATTGADGGRASYTIKARAIDDSLNIAVDHPRQETVHGYRVAPNTFSLFEPSRAGHRDVATDGQPVELGMKFTADRDGQITELKYYRAAGDAGDIDVREGHLWGPDGTLLATVTFTSAAGQIGLAGRELAQPGRDHWRPGIRRFLPHQ